MQQIKLAAIILLTILAILLLASNGANPDRLDYGFKRAQEKLYLSLKFTPLQKIDYYDTLLSKRLNELEYLTNNKKTYLLWQSSLRYAATAGEVTDVIINNNFGDKADQFVEKFKQHQEVINNLLTNYPGDLDPTEENSKFLTDDINSLTSYIDKLSQVK